MVGSEAVFVIRCCAIVVTAPWFADVEQPAVPATAAAAPVSAGHFLRESQCRVRQVVPSCVD